MVNKVFQVSGNKITAFITDETALKFSSSTAETVDAFRESFSKKLSLATKFEIKYNAIKSIKKEDNDNDILIKYKSALGLPSECEFSFDDQADNDIFFTFFEKEMFFTKNMETLTPFRAIRSYVIGLIATIAVAVFMYYQAIEIANGTADEPHGGKAKFFNYIVGFLGDKGVIGLGTIISGYLIFKIWKRFSNPPNQIKLLPPNA